LISLNRLIVYAEVNGPETALEEIQRLPDKDLLKNYYLYPAVLGEWHAQIGNNNEARNYLEQAIQLTHSPSEKQLLASKISKLL
jgi:RNA polymerase sigma-70 factor (ECF subfamily)